MDILDYFGLDDGIDVTWYHAANSHQKLDEALETTMMIEGDITLRWAGHPNQVISHSPRTYTYHRIKVVKLSSVKTRGYRRRIDSEWTNTILWNFYCVSSFWVVSDQMTTILCQTHLSLA